MWRNNMSAITVEALLTGAKAIELARDEVRHFLGIMKPICSNCSLITEKFTLPDTERRFWWQLKQTIHKKSFFQLWEVVSYGHIERLWEGFADDVPSSDKVICVRKALPFLLSDCEKKIPDFAEKIQPYLIS